MKVDLISPLQIERNPTNPRRIFDKEKLAQLTSSILEVGVQQPLVVRQGGAEGKYQLIFGERRLRASMQAVQDDPEMVVPVIIRDFTDEEVLRVQLIENLLRDDMSPLEEGEAYLRLKTEYGSTSSEIAELVGLPVDRIRSRLKLTQLPSSIRARLDNNEIPLHVVYSALAAPVESIESAITVAMESSTPKQAREIIQQRYVRPQEERQKWESSEYRNAAAEIWARQGVEVSAWLSFERSRELFPQSVDNLYEANAGTFRDALETPDRVKDDYMGGSAEGLGMRWADFANDVDVPIVAACDGSMKPRVLVDSQLVKEAARVRFKNQPEACWFAFTGADGQEAKKAQTDARMQAVRTDEEAREVIEKRMLSELREATKTAPNRQFFESCLDLCISATLLGFAHEHPLLFAVDALELKVGDGEKTPVIPRIHDGEESAMMHIEALVVCAAVYHYMRECSLNELEECPEWHAAMAAYGYTT